MSIVTVAKARERLGLAAAANHRDAEIQDLIDAAEGHVEDLSGFVLERRPVERPLRIDEDGVVRIYNAWPSPDLTKITYLDGELADQEIADLAPLRVDKTVAPVKIYTAAGGWPSDYSQGGVATLTAGFATLDDVPAKLVQAVLILVAQWFEDPDGERMISDHVHALCAGFRQPF